MFHIHIEGTFEFLEGYGNSTPEGEILYGRSANGIMGEWFGQLNRRQRLFIVFINWPNSPLTPEG